MSSVLFDSNVNLKKCKVGNYFSVPPFKGLVNSLRIYFWPITTNIFSSSTTMIVFRPAFDK